MDFLTITNSFLELFRIYFLNQYFLAIFKYKNCEIKMILNGLERGKDIVSFTKKGNIKLASKISREKFLNTLKKSLV